MERRPRTTANHLRIRSERPINKGNPMFDKWNCLIRWWPARLLATRNPATLCVAEHC